MDDVKLTIYARSLGTDTAGREHKTLRDAVDAASVSGEVTYLQNSMGARVAAVVPLEMAEYALRHGWGR